MIARTDSLEIAGYELGNMMEHNLDDTVRLLARTPAGLDALLRDLPQTWTSRNEGENTWSAFDVVGHLVHGERTDWMLRAKMILQFGETRAFEPFDRRGRPPALGVVPLSELLATWAAHDLTHLHQISRVMAHQYREAVGPWSGYLGVLQCAGHSASS